MRICIVFTNFHLIDLTAQPAIIYSVVKKLKEKNEEVYVISNSKYSAYRQNNIFIIKGDGNFRTYILNIFKIIKWLKKIKPDILHIHGYLLTVFFSLLNFLIKAKIFSSVSETIEIVDNLFLRKIIIYFLKKIKNIFVTADYIKQQLIKLGIDNNKIIVTRIGLKEEFLNNPDNKIEEEFDILYFGDALKTRGFDIVLLLARQLLSLKFRILLRWIDKDLYNELNVIKSLNNVEVLYYPYYKEPIKNYILKSKIILLPYRWIGVRPPLSLIESMALGKCVMTSDMPSIEEIIEDKINGFMFNLNKLDELVKEINFLQAHSEVRKKIGLSAKNTIISLYTEKEYEKIISSYYGS